jgi:hypothetical protein
VAVSVGGTVLVAVREAVAVAEAVALATGTIVFVGAGVAAVAVEVAARRGVAVAVAAIVVAVAAGRLFELSSSPQPDNRMAADTPMRMSTDRLRTSPPLETVTPAPGRDRIRDMPA